MEKQNKEFSILDLGREFLRQKPNNNICRFADIVGLKIFSILLANENLQGMFVDFPRKSTLKKVIMRAKIRNSLENLKSQGSEFQIRKKELAEMFGLHTHQILQEFRISKGEKRYEK